MKLTLWKLTWFPNALYSKSKFRLGWSLPHPTLYVKRDIYESLGWYDERFVLAGDYELMLRLFYVNKVSSYYLQETTVKMRTGGAAGKGLASRIVGLMEIRKAWLIHGYRPWLLTIMMKPLRKLHQWVLPKLMWVFNYLNNSQKGRFKLAPDFYYKWFLMILLKIH